MKRFILYAIFLIGSVTLAQTDGLIYQTVILDPNAQEVPGQDITGNVLRFSEVALEFTITEGGNVIYKEQQRTNTNGIGMLKVIVGMGDPSIGNFNEIEWNGLRKNLDVAVNLDGQFVPFSSEKLLFIPYASHRNITATGTLSVDKSVVFNNNLVVNGTTNLRDSLSVNNQSETLLTGTLEVNRAVILNNTLDVLNESSTFLNGTMRVDLETKLNESLEVKNVTKLRSSLDVEGRSLLNGNWIVDEQSNTIMTGDLQVDGISNLNSEVNINNGSDANVSGELRVFGETVLDNDLIVNGKTNLNGSLSINNDSPTQLSGILGVNGQSALEQDLMVIGATNFDNFLRVNNESLSKLTGTLEVGLATNLNDTLSVKNESPTVLSGTLNVAEMSAIKQTLTVDGITNLNNTLNVNEGSPTVLSGSLGVDDATSLGSTLEVQDNTVLNNNLEVLNLSPTSFTGDLEVDNPTTLQSELTVTGGAESSLNGILDVEKETVLNNGLIVNNSSPSGLSGRLIVDGATILNSSLNVQSGTRFTGTLEVSQLATTNSLLVDLATPTNFTGILNVDGATNLQDRLNVSGLTNFNNALTVRDTLNAGTLRAESMEISGNSNQFLASFSNTSDALDSKGIRVKLGRNHPRWNGTQFIKTAQIYVSDDPETLPAQDPTYTAAWKSVKDLIAAGVGNPSPPQIDPSVVIGLLENNLALQGTLNIQNLVIDQMNAELGLPINLPSITLPGFTVPGFESPRTFFPGISGACSGRACFSICFPFAGCTTICIPPVDVCVPSIPAVVLPALNVPTVNIASLVPNFMGQIPVPGLSLPDTKVPTIPSFSVPNSLSKENNYMVFEDFEARQTGAIRANSIGDFVNNTINDDLYVFNVLATFEQLDVIHVLAKSAAAMSKLSQQFNKLGIEYASGNGDYAEWLERQDIEEYISAGDIVGVIGGKISKDLTNAEQIMVVSHHPIVHGNTPEKGKEDDGNIVAFIGQVPVKVLGPVRTGDYIVALDGVTGYGKAIAPNKMLSSDFKWAIGRSWEENLTDGPKTVNTVVGLQNGDWGSIVEELDEKQDLMNKDLDNLDAMLQKIQEKLETTTQKEKTYASKE